MRTKSAPNSVLGLVGLACLTIYILACTSFSPDDSKVLYPTYDPQAREFGVGLYDRATGKTTTLFVPQRWSLDEAEPGQALLRPQWLPDGRHILVGWTWSVDDDGLGLAVLPYRQVGPTRLIFLADIPEGGAQLANPLATAGGYLFLHGESNALVRVNLLTGEVSRREMAKEVIPYASPAGDRVCYLSELNGAEKEWEFGQIDPTTWTLKPITQSKRGLETKEGPIHPISPDGKWVVGLDETAGEGAQVGFFEDGVERRRVILSGKSEKLKLGGLVFSAPKRTAYAAYFRTGEGETNASVGIVEIPLRGEPRRTVLVKRVEAEEEERVFYFQPSLSHDGKTLAVASTYLAAGDAFIGEEDCALFLVNLADAKRKVTRVPVPRPPMDME